MEGEMTQDETIYYRDGSAIVTNLRATVGGKTYALADITSVSVGQKHPGRWVGIIVAVVGIALVAYAASLISSGGTAWLFVVVGAVIAIVGGYLAISPRTEHFVIIASSSGEAHALTSRDKVRIAKVADIINDARAKQG
jgi:hypothetical protein